MWSGGFFDHLGLRGKCLYRRRIKGLRGWCLPTWRGSDPLPNQARYQLRYTRIFNFCHDTTASGKNKVFSVCGHSCGQNRFCAVFCNRGKSRKRRCRKALRRFASSYPGYNHGTPKAGALPTALHPDIIVFCYLPACFACSACGARKNPRAPRRLGFFDRGACSASAAPPLFPRKKPAPGADFSFWSE